MPPLLLACPESCLGHPWSGHAVSNALPCPVTCNWLAMPWPTLLWACRESCLGRPWSWHAVSNALPCPVTSNQLAMPWPPLLLECRESCLGQTLVLACRGQCIALPDDTQSACHALATPFFWHAVSNALPCPVTSNQLAMHCLARLQAISLPCLSCLGHPWSWHAVSNALPCPVTRNQLAMPWPNLVLACRESCLGHPWSSNAMSNEFPAR
ncbi:hypothetical protein RHGRI_010875 [Rhododendron griersonianum]|uniref:Uncharacterized protein n=1 Tax=Rhododendron griersonianum TaxID=479676 RepID=A0AAV6KK07_9ERIC|nr:hypothetical protein RHGRI_010875 [Rhododendron griersonianum]